MESLTVCRGLWMMFCTVSMQANVEETVEEWEKSVVGRRKPSYLFIVI
jgi:hypothetical protein